MDTPILIPAREQGACTGATAEGQKQEPLIQAKSRKVIAFDSWTVGSSHVQRLVDAFAQRGLDLFLIHIGSWGHEPGRAPEERIGNLLARDISYYGGASLPVILETERPAAVLFLSTQALAHRAFNRYCMRMGIPTLHLYHGIVNVQSTAAKRLNPLNVRSQLKLAISRARKNLGLLWPLYIKALWKTHASIRDWAWFPYTVWRQVCGRSYTGVAAPDASTSACCVYTPADIEHASVRYRIAKDRVYPVGNPDLVQFGVAEQDLGACLANTWKPSRDVMYIDTALLESGAAYDDAEDFVAHLKATSDYLAAKGYGLVVKLHPGHFRTGVAKLLDAAGIKQCGSAEFVAQLRHCAACIVEPSTLAIVPALMGLPVLLGMYGKLGQQRYGEVLTSYPGSRSLDELRAFEQLVLDAHPGKRICSTRRWLALNCGPMPAEDMPYRVAAVLSSLVDQETAAG